jgi:hypothetical protein
VIVESRSGREAFMADSFVDSTGYGDLCAQAGAEFWVPNDYKVVNSFGLANASIDNYHSFIDSHGAVLQFCRGPRSREEGRIIRVDAEKANIPGFTNRAKEIGVSSVTTPAAEKRAGSSGWTPRRRISPASPTEPRRSAYHR